MFSVVVSIGFGGRSGTQRLPRRVRFAIHVRSFAICASVVYWTSMGMVFFPMFCFEQMNILLGPSIESMAWLICPWRTRGGDCYDDPLSTAVSLSGMWAETTELRQNVLLQKYEACTICFVAFRLPFMTLSFVC